jgi:very-short-patch-repair endonuclease
MTDAERKLWSRLRGQQVADHHFRRQVPRGRYILDFVCLAARLVVEVDGGQHMDEMRADLRRTDWLRSRGFEVLRFWNREVLLETDGVVEVIYEAVRRRAPTPTLPQRGEGDLRDL